MRLPTSIQGSREERVAQFKQDPELMGVATKLVSEVIEKAKVEAMRRRKSGPVQTAVPAAASVPQQASVDAALGLPADATLGAAGAAGAAGVPGGVPGAPSGQRIKLALGNIKERVSTAYGSLAERLRTGYRVSLERPWGRGATDRLRNPFTSRRGSGQGAQGPQQAQGGAPGSAPGSANGGHGALARPPGDAALGSIASQG